MNAVCLGRISTLRAHHRSGGGNTASSGSLSRSGNDSLQGILWNVPAHWRFPLHSNAGENTVCVHLCVACLTLCRGNYCDRKISSMEQLIVCFATSPSATRFGSSLLAKLRLIRYCSVLARQLHWSALLKCIGGRRSFQLLKAVPHPVTYTLKGRCWELSPSSR